MKKYSISIIACFILFTIGLYSCEKDDLCDPSLSTTPRLIITFVDITEPDERKTVEVLQLREIGTNEFAPLDSSGATLLTAVDSIAIPLRTDNQTTSYFFSRENASGINVDTIDFNYTLEEIYINRACGFKVVYNNLGAVQNSEPPGEEWIGDVRVLNENVTSNNDIHIEIRH